MRFQIGQDNLLRVLIGFEHALILDHPYPQLVPALIGDALLLDDLGRVAGDALIIGLLDALAIGQAAEFGVTFRRPPPVSGLARTAVIGSSGSEPAGRPASDAIGSSRVSASAGPAPRLSAAAAANVSMMRIMATPHATATSAMRCWILLA